MTPVFELKGRTTNVEVTTKTDLSEQLGLYQLRAHQRGHRPGLRFRPRGQLLHRPRQRRILDRRRPPRYCDHSRRALRAVITCAWSRRWRPARRTWIISITVRRDVPRSVDTSGSLRCCC